MSKYVPRVNLGLLYSKSPGGRAGWGYFEDGSVYLSMRPWGSDSDHAGFEAQMRFFEPFVRTPPADLGNTRLENPSLSRLIVLDTTPALEHANIETGCSVLARNAADGRILPGMNRPFRICHLVHDYQVNHSRSAVRLDQNPAWLPARLQAMLSEAFHVFRGTFVDGVLQPNVHLGNGLRLSTHSPFDGTSSPKGTQKSGLNSVDRAQQDGLESRSSDRARSRSHVDEKYAETKTRGLTAREAVVSKREGAVVKAETEVVKREVAVVKAETEVVKRENIIVKGEAVMVKDKALVSEREAAVTKREAAVTKREAAVTERELMINKREAAYNKRQAALNRKEATLNTREPISNRTEPISIHEIVKTRRRGNAPGSMARSAASRQRRSAPDYNNIFPELAGSGPSKYRNRITLPRQWSP